MSASHNHRISKQLSGRMIVVGVVSVLTLTGGCISRAGEAPSAHTKPVSTAQSPTTTSSPPTTVQLDAAITAEAADILASADVKRFNDRICPDATDLPPLSSIGSDYANATPAGIETHNVPGFGEATAITLNIRPGEADLVIVLGVHPDTYDWCSLATEWCPVEYAGLPPFTTGQFSDYPELQKITRIILCEH